MCVCVCARVRARARVCACVCASACVYILKVLKVTLRFYSSAHNSMLARRIYQPHDLSTQTEACTRTHTCTHMHARAHSHAHAHECTCAHRCTHKHSQVYTINDHTECELMHRGRNHARVLRGMLFLAVQNLTGHGFAPIIVHGACKSEVYPVND